jgi:hypothetical protein
MNPSERRPILYKGELYNKPIQKKSGGPEKKPSITYSQARTRILADLESTKARLKEVPADLKLPNEFVVCVRVDKEFSAKSYYPTSVFNSGLEEVGSKIWKSQDGSERGKMFFARATLPGIEKFENSMKEDEEDVTKSFALDIRRLKSIDLLTPEEKIINIPENWDSGRLEVVIHPFSVDGEKISDHFKKLINELGIKSKTYFRQYDKGVIFVSIEGTREVIEKLSRYNPIRTIHTLQLRSFPIPVMARSATLLPAPKPPQSQERSSIEVGIFDGGAIDNHPYIQPFSENIDLVTSPIDFDWLAHGTSVAGAVLYGPLNNLNETDTLPTPPVSVKNFRIMPPDSDAYDVIDAIEATVPKYPQIKVYNLSIGPEHPILDDDITRFTFAMDTLSARHNILFCSAVGNSGDSQIDYLHRMQPPSDMVNGLAVGAFSENEGVRYRAPYSCIGPGREGSKLKPDLVAFGGCLKNPIHLINLDPGKKILLQGTSFASPLVASYAAQLIGLSDDVLNPLVARAMLIHSTRLQTNDPHNNEIGHGTLTSSVNEIVTCKKNSYTLIYQGELTPGKYTEFQIPWMSEFTTGKVNFSWTSVILSEIDSGSPDDYTSTCTMLSFYPHSKKYKFAKDGVTRTVDLNANPEEGELLLTDGWVKNNFPVTETTDLPYETEEELRTNMKWDTVDCRNTTKKVQNIFEPTFHIHTLSRGKSYSGDKVKFALILTVEIADESVDLYSKIINKYDALVALQLSVQNQVPIQITI